MGLAPLEREYPGTAYVLRRYGLLFAGLTFRVLLRLEALARREIGIPWLISPD